MRKIISIMIISCVLFSLPFQTNAESTTIKVEVPTPDYQMSIPSDMTIPYQAENCSLNMPTIIQSTGFKQGMYLKVAINYSGAFTSSTASTTIPFTFNMVAGDNPIAWNSGEILIFDRTDIGGVNTHGRTSNGEVPTEMVLSISDAAWEAAFPGIYTTVITFTASLATSE